MNGETLLHRAARARDLRSLEVLAPHPLYWHNGKRTECRGIVGDKPSTVAQQCDNGADSPYNILPATVKTHTHEIQTNSEYESEKDTFHNALENTATGFGFEQRDKSNESFKT